MKKKLHENTFIFIFEALIFAALLLMIALTVSSGKTADFSIEEAASAVIQVMDSEALQKEDSLKIRERFGLSDSDYEQAVYYGPVSNMDVEELLILKFPENSDLSSTEDVLQARIDYQKSNFDGYGTNQMELLNDAEIQVKGNYAVLIISENADEAVSVYRKYLKGGR